MATVIGTYTDKQNKCWDIVEGYADTMPRFYWIRTLQSSEMIRVHADDIKLNETEATTGKDTKEA